MFIAGDEASLYLQATLQVVWTQRGQTPIIKRHPGRHSTHFYGGLNLHTGAELAMRSPVMDGETSALFLNKILIAYPVVPIVLLWDRATWHSGPPIKVVLEANPRLQLIYLPTAAPDLNPQEHVWKATRGAISHNHSQKKLEQLADDFEAYLTTHNFPSSFLNNYNYSQLCMLFK